MRIVNVTKKNELADSFIECVSFFEQLRGMMFRKNIVPLVFRFSEMQNISLHSWFCPGVMDLVFLDDCWEVVELKSEWGRWSNYHPAHKFMFLLELPVGSIARSNTEIGDVVHIVK